MLLIKNCRLYNQSPSDGLTDILIENGKIFHIGQRSDIQNAEITDAGGRWLSPGFIDIHIQGAGGADVMDSAEALMTISHTLARFGVTGFLATTVCKPEIENRHLKVIADATNKNLGGARILGIHLEGPFINPQKRGGISASALHPPSISELEKIISISNGALRMMTIAPEIPGNLELIQTLVNHNIVASFGHSAANYQETLAGFTAGISHATHLFNAMLPIHHREPGPIPAIFESQNITAQIIADGVHLHPTIIKFILSNLGIDRCICITDGVQGIGLPDGRYVYNGREYESHDGAARYDDGTLIGTTIGVNEIASRFRRFTGCSFAESLQTITLNAARVIGKEKTLGKIVVGADADLVLLDQDESIYMTIVQGKSVYHKKY